MILDNTLTSCTYTDRQWELLRKHLSRCTVDNLCTRGLMIFLHCLNEYKKEFREQSVCEIVDDKISTGNIVGFVGIEENNERVELSIRYFQLLPQRPQWQLLHKKKRFLFLCQRSPIKVWVWAMVCKHTLLSSTMILISRHLGH